MNNVNIFLSDDSWIEEGLVATDLGYPPTVVFFSDICSKLYEEIGDVVHRIPYAVSIFDRLLEGLLLVKFVISTFRAIYPYSNIEYVCQFYINLGPLCY